MERKRILDENCWDEAFPSFAGLATEPRASLQYSLCCRGAAGGMKARVRGALRRGALVPPIVFMVLGGLRRSEVEINVTLVSSETQR